jgi:hypothetical protein
MTLIDSIGFTGVAILVAFMLNAAGRLSRDHIAYIAMNFTGAGIACAASVLLNYWPFIILEGAWALVSLVALVNYFRKTSGGPSFVLIFLYVSLHHEKGIFNLYFCLLPLTD